MFTDPARDTQSAFAKSTLARGVAPIAAPAVEGARTDATTLAPTILGPLYVNDEGNADGPVALLWPSLFTDHRMWRHPVAALRADGWRTLAVDPPGHGRSIGPGRSFTMDECAEAAVQVLDARGIRAPVVMLGTSWGGFVAPRVALRAPDRVRGLVLFNTSAERPSLFDREKTTLLTKLLDVAALDKAVYGMVTSSMLCAETRRRQPEIEAELAKHLRAWDRRGVIATVRSVLVERDSVLDALPGVNAPALVVSGNEDHLLPSIHSQRIAAKLANGRHVEVPGAAHLVPLERPQVAASLILDFVRQLSA